MSKDKNSGHGITFWGALQVLFIGLKLAGCIDWPWWAVMMPMITWLLIVLACFLVIGVAYYAEHKDD